MDIYKTNYNFSSDEAYLIQEEISLNEKVSFNINIELSDINNGEMISISLKIPGTAFNSPYEIPYENYRLEFMNSGIKYIVNDMVMTEWKEVYLYSYNLKFKTLNIVSEVDKEVNKVEFLIPNLLIGYDEMIMADGIINRTSLNLKYLDKEYNITLEANPEFNSKDNPDIKIKNNITSKIVFDNIEINDLENVYKVNDILIDLISFAYGGFRPYLIVNYYNNEEIKGTNIYSKDNINSNKILGLIPYQYSNILSEYIKQTFDNYLNMTYKDKTELMLFVKVLFESISRLNLSESSNILNYLYELAKIKNQYLEESKDLKYQKRYKRFYEEVNTFHKILLQKIGYKGKYINWSNIIPTIEDLS